MSSPSQHALESYHGGPDHFRVADVRDFDVQSFAARWCAARLAACRAVVGEEREDAEALLALDATARDALLRAVFDNGRRFGLSAVRHFRATWDLEDFAELLPRLGAPCVAFTCVPQRASQVVRRAGCGELREGGGFVCDYWREAIDGLVMGLGDDVFLSRHSSRGNGGPDCVDVLYVERNTRTRTNPSAELRLAPLDNEVVLALEAQVRRALSVKLALTIDGVAEGVVHYRLSGSAEDLSSGAAARLRQSIAAKLAMLATPLRALDVSPRPVLMGEP